MQTIFCCTTGAETVLSGAATTVFKMVQLSHQATADVLSDKYRFPYFNRVCASDQFQAEAIVSILTYLADKSGLKQYREFSIIATSNDYGVDGARQIEKLAKEENLIIKTFQQFLPGATDVTVEIQELKSTGARVFVGIAGPIEFRPVLIEANKTQLIGDTYVWICFDACATEFVYQEFYTGAIDPELREDARGMIGVTNWQATGPQFDAFVILWNSLDPIFYPSAGPGTYPSNLTTYAYDAIYFLAAAIQTMIDMGAIDDNGYIADIDLYTQTIRSTVIDGLTGTIKLDELGNRVASYNINNFRQGSDTPVTIGSWFPEEGLQFTMDIQFFDGTENIPDIDVRPPFAYWDCEDGKRKVDLTGKTVSVKKPGAGNPNNIDYDYYCDSFIDCHNLSDESAGGCVTNYEILFIVFGVITGVLILIAIIFLIITILFGFIFRRHRFVSSSPLFLIVMIIACILGYGSIYAWFGKPQPVACGFQPWLLGLGVILLFAALCSKTFRIWRIFKSPMNKKVITDLELFILMVIIMIPCVFILFLWTLISTPTATLKEADGADHYICATGGFTGPPGGFVFFFILVAYAGIVLCFGGFLSIVTRKVPSAYNESKLIAVSIYNLVFLSIAIIPVVVTLQTINPFVAWIIRTVGILYAFTTTLWLQFLPKIIGLIFFDRCKKTNIASKTKTLSDIDSKASKSGSSGGGALANIPETFSGSSD